MTLALLLTAVGGAWAQTETLLTTITPSGKGSYSETTAGVVTVTHDNNDFSVDYGWLWYSQSGSLTVEAKEGYTITKCVFKQNAKTPVEITTSPFAITFDDRGDCVQNDDMDGVTSIEVYGPAAPTEPAIDVTTNAAEEGATFTEASFLMPTYDVDVNYELVRDMSIQMTATMGDGTDGLRYRVKKAQQGEGYEPADMNMMQVLALVAVNDGIEQKALTLNQDYYCRIYKLDEQTLQPEGDGVELVDFDFAPGLYALKAVAKDGSNYDGETALSNTFKLFQGYEITVPAGEFVTYYKDEPLRIEDQEADLYTIQSVSADQAVLSSPSDAMPSNTPMLVYNKSNETKVILLIPCAEPDMAITVAPEFKGTAVEKTVSADEVAATNFYVLTDQNQFVWVKDAGTIAAHRCWLEIAPSQAAGARRIVFSGSETTGIDAATLRDMTTGDWYDLNGRKLNGMPTKKGVYIFNGRKVVIR